MSKFSFFRAPVSNVMPYRTVTLQQIHQVLTADYYRMATEALRQLCARRNRGEVTQRDVQHFKATHFDYVTFSGVFTRRSADALQEHSGLLALDFDHIDHWQGEGLLHGVYGLRYALLHDPSLTTALIFRSPSGDGLKWVVPIDLQQGSHAEWFRVLSYYVETTYGVAPDPSGKDVVRACYLPWDPDALLF